MSLSVFPGTSRYEVLRKLGEGGMGAVYAAHDVERDETVALKVLTHSDPRALLRFKTEYRSLQDLEHPNLVRLGELVESEGVWFFSMELVDGVDLVEHVRAGAPPVPGYDESRLRAGFQQLALGLDALHAGNKIHRDIKPSNILVAQDGRVVLLDLGLVADTAAHDRSTGGFVLGTVAYMSPEQAASRSLTPASDWYGFGTVLYQALTGDLPFEGSLIELMMAKQRHDPPPPSAVVESVPPDLDELCADLLRFDPERRPSGKDVLRRLGLADIESHAPSSWTTLTDSHIFVGRTHELDSLRAALDDATSEAPARVYVHGRSGMGKTSLIARFLDDVAVADEHAIILRGRCYEQESVPFKAVDGIIDALSRALCHLPGDVLRRVLPDDAARLPKLFPVLGRVDAISGMARPRAVTGDLHEVRQVAFRTLRELLAQLASHRQVIISIDDFQWTDGDSISLLRAVLGGETPPDIALVLSSREPEPPDLFDDDGARMADWRRVEVRPLELGEGAELARRLLAAVDPRVRVDCTALATEAQGHPLFIAELVRHVATSDRGQTLKLELDEAICQRVRDLPAPARSLVELLSVASSPLSLPTVEIATGLAGDELARMLALLRVVALVRSSRERPVRRVQPFHDRVREAVGRQLSNEAAMMHHVRLASALEADAAAPPEAVAFHARAAGQADKAAEFYERAGDRAVAGLAFDRAASFYRQVVELSNMPSADAVSLRVRIAEALAHAGRGVEAAAEYRAAAEHANAAERVRLRNLGAIHLLRSGHVDEGMRALDEVLRSVNLRIPQSRSSAVPMLLMERARLALGGLRCKLRDVSEIAPHDLIRVDALAGVAESLAWVDGIRAAGIGSRWLRAALRCGEREQVVRALCFEAVFCSLVGPRRSAKTARILQRARDIAVALERPEMDLYIGTSEALVAQHECRFGDTYRLGRGLLEVYESHPGRLPWELATVRLVWLFGLLMTGRFRAFVDTSEVMLRDANERSDRWFSSILRVLMGPWAALTRYDDPAQARALLDEGIEPWRDREFGLIHFNWLNSAVWTETYNGNGMAGVELLDRHRRDLVRSGSMRVKFLRIAIAGTDGAAHLAWFDETGDRRALARVRRIARRLHREGVSFAVASGHNLEGAIAMRTGDVETAVRCLAQGAQCHRDAGLDGFAIGVDWHRGLLAGGDEGAALVRHAEAFFERERVANPVSFSRCLGFPPPRS